jgi:putative membrane protein insertion efficiency factor
MTAKLLIAFIRVYQLTLSPLLGGSCRFTPSCSAYAREALEVHGAWRGSMLAIRRLSKCHPFGASGLDPVPAPEAPRAPRALRAPRAPFAPRI